MLKDTIYKDAEFTAFLDTEGNETQKRVLSHLYPAFYKEIFTIPSKKYSKMVIESQFGKEEMRGFIENIPDEWMAKINAFDKVYNFHIDSLKFTEYPELQWAKNHRNFPTPFVHSANYLGKYIVSHIISSTGTEHKTESWWTDKLIIDLDAMCVKMGIGHMIIATPDINEKYDDAIKKCHSTVIMNGDVEDVCELISHCVGFVGIDSAWRLVSHAFGKPTITLSKNCRGVGEVPPSHQLRWLPFPETTLGIYTSTSAVINRLKKIMDNQVYSLFPGFAESDSRLNDLLIKRDYKVNKEESVLNVANIN